MIGTVIELSPNEQAICKMIAEKRHDNNRSLSVKNSKIGPQSDTFTDLEGIAAELAFCKIFNTYPDFSIHIRSATHETDKGDVTLPDGKTVDIKTTKYPNGKLLAVPWKKVETDFMALMVGQFPKYTYKGMIPTTEVIQDRRLGNLGYGPTYIVFQNELK